MKARNKRVEVECYGGEHSPAGAIWQKRAFYRWGGRPFFSLLLAGEHSIYILLTAASDLLIIKTKHMFDRDLTNHLPALSFPGANGVRNTLCQYFESNIYLVQ